MPYLSLSNGHTADRKIMVFAEGTILKSRSLLALYDHRAYVPIGNAVTLIAGWEQQGAEIVYCTSRRGRQAQDMAELLRRFDFRGTRLYYRERRQPYHALVEEIRPAVLVEDDCRSIGGSWQMCITRVPPELKRSMKSVVVPEFRGIDHLPPSIL